MAGTVTILGSDIMEITPDPTGSNSTELIPKKHVLAVVPVKYQERQPGDIEWDYRYNSITILCFYLIDGRKFYLELQTVSNQPTWNTGTPSGLNNGLTDVQTWLNGSGTLAPGPGVVVSDGFLTFPDTTINLFSAAQSFVVSGTNLTNNIVITAPAGYIINLTGNNVNASPITLVQVAGTVAPTTIFMKFAPTAVQNYNATATVTSTGAPANNINLTANTATPTITVSTSSLSFPNTTTNQISASQNYTVSGAALGNNITITAPAGYIINLNGSTVDAGPIVLAHASGVVAPTIIYVRFSPTSPGSYVGNITNVSALAVTKNVALDGIAPVPVITVLPTSISFPDTEQSSFSPAQSYTVSGTDLYSNTTITAPAGFIINLNGSNVNAGPIVLPHTGGVLAATTIYVLFNPTAIQQYSANVTNAATGAVTKNVLVTGLGKFAQNKLSSYYHNT